MNALSSTALKELNLANQAGLEAEPSLAATSFKISDYLTAGFLIICEKF